MCHLLSDVTGPPCRLYSDVTWPLCRLFSDVTWPLCRLFSDITWPLCQLFSDVTWPLCRLFDVTWPLCRVFSDITRRPCRLYSDVTWPLCRLFSDVSHCADNLATSSIPQTRQRTSDGFITEYSTAKGTEAAVPKWGSIPTPTLRAVKNLQKRLQDGRCMGLSLPHVPRCTITGLWYSVLYCRNQETAYFFPNLY